MYIGETKNSGFYSESQLYISKLNYNNNNNNNNNNTCLLVSHGSIILVSLQRFMSGTMAM